ncbi:MAG: bifunctional 4-hydroxy-2-oxoglutarate aldolase/2-dehydro-3-deoxy-phosphogluconate aldolase [Clostridia bacterium]|nr:bifunctional 4-hydroxy-2-oxoglutarate aldolase/2-dehydro-3-deoxy-phosphogluconate aldolase [Clostridia bacterium]
MSSGIIQEIEKEKIIVIVRGADSDHIIPLAEAMYKGGIRFLEITYDQSGKTSDAETAGMIRALAAEFGGKLCVGAGTVLTEKQVELTHASGGEFIISPDVNEEVIRMTKKLRMISVPGAMTPTEIAKAHRCGADFVKIFPASTLGPAYIKAVSAPLSGIKLLAVGGIDENNMNDFLRAGVCGFGVGSNIVNKKMIRNNDWDGIERLAMKFREELFRTDPAAAVRQINSENKEQDKK